MTDKIDHIDVLIVGAGISGIGAAYYLQKKCPNKTYLILDARTRIGGTWDLFKYPGIRSDSDMQTMGYAFRPWVSTQSIAEGHLIRTYVEDTAKEAGIDAHMRFQHHVIRAAWSSANNQWTIEAIRTDSQGRKEAVQLTCNFFFSCAGYYKYDQGYTPNFPGKDNFKGTLIHPQKWPEDLNYDGKKIIVIGSGATAITLVPNLAKTAAHVTMLQRSPTYIVSRPREDLLANALRKVLPEKLAYFLTRWRNISLMAWIYRRMTQRPDWARAELEKLTRKELGDHFVQKDFTPRYNPWEQRLCLIPDSDLFVAIKDGRVKIETDGIETFTEHGIKLKSGKELHADIIVTATGFNLQFLGGIELEVDGKTIDQSKLVTYKGIMFSNVPNLFAIFGYINASWTLKVDVACSYVCRLLHYMDKTSTKRVTARLPNTDQALAPFIENFGSGYVQREIEKWPKQGSNEPWRAHQNYFRDIRILKYGSLKDDALEFDSVKR